MVPRRGVPACPRWYSRGCCTPHLQVVTCKSLVTPTQESPRIMSVLEELQAAVASVAQQVGPAVVGIGQRQRGSGVIVAAGRVVTNAHNLRGGETTVRFADGRTATGRVAGVDWDGDLAVVEVDTAGATPLGFGDGQPSVGAAVFGAAATPSGAPRVTVGFVSSVERAFRGP